MGAGGGSSDGWKGGKDFWRTERGITMVVQPLALSWGVYGTPFTNHLFGALSGVGERVPRATQRIAQPHGGGDEDISLAGLDFLERPNVQVGKFGELFLGDAEGGPLTAQVSPEGFELASDGGRKWHAPSCRNADFDRTA